MPDLVRLRPVSEEDLPILERIYTNQDDASEFGFYGWSDPGRLRRSWRDNGCFHDDGSGTLAVVRADEVLGDVSWHRVQQGPTSYCWNIGIALLASARGKGYGTAAQRLLGVYLFSHTQVNRIEASTETGNVAEQRSLEKAGFTREGVLRGANFRAGTWRDMALFSVLRGEVDLG